MAQTTISRRPGLIERTMQARVDKQVVAELESLMGPHQASIIPSRQVPGRSLVASAARITSKTVESNSFRKSTHEAWQDDAWSMYDLVGEQRFLSTNVAARASQARFFVGKVARQGEDPVEVEDPEIQSILDAIGDGPQGLAQLVQRLVLNLFITGDGWLVGIPKDLMPSMPGLRRDEETVDRSTGLPEVRRITRTEPTLGETAETADDQTLDALEWRMLSVSEIHFEQVGDVKLTLGPTEGERITVSPDDVYLIRVWRPHPRFFWQADSPTRSSLPVLRELVGLTMHISAQVDSRLAGAGLLIVPESASRAVKRAMGLPDDDPSDPFTESLIQSMLTPISDRSNASAYVPLVVTVPDAAANLFQHITFDKPLDQEARQMRDEAIRRLALGQDAPPELLLGTGGMNHWGAWLVREDVVSAHIEPPLSLICDALTTQYLRPILIANGMSEDEAKSHVFWYDVDHMIIRPNRAADAKDLYKEGAISDQALREANGFDESAAPDEETDDPAIVAAFEMVQANPGLMRRPGMDVIVEQLRALLGGNPLGAIDGASKAVAAETIDSSASAETDVETPNDPANTAPAEPGRIPVTSGAPAKRPVLATGGTMTKPAGLRGSLSLSLEEPTIAGVEELMGEVDPAVMDLNGYQG